MNDSLDAEIRTLVHRAVESAPPAPTAALIGAATNDLAPARRPARSNWFAALGAALVVVVLVAGALVLIGPQARDKRPVERSEPRPAANWEHLPPGPLSPRARANAVWTGSEVLVFGGETFICPPQASCARPKDPPLSDGAAYNPATQSWRAIANLPVPVGGAATAVVGGRVYVATWGATWRRSGAVGGVPKSFLRYTIADDRWEQLSPPVQPHFSIVAAGDSVVAVSAGDENIRIADTIFDPVTERWSDLPESPLTAGFDRTMVEHSGMLYLFDHALGSAPDEPPITRAARLDVTTRVWERLPDSNILGTTPWLAVGRRLVQPGLGSEDGGETNNWGRRVPYGGAFDTATSEWVPIAPGNGVPAGAFSADTAVFTRTDGKVLDVGANTWLEMPSLDVFHAGVIAAGVDAFAFGGVSWKSTSEPQLSNDAWIWRTSERQPESTSTSAPATTTTASPTPIALTRSGGCGDAFFWAVNAQDTLALTVTVDPPGAGGGDWGDDFDVAAGSLRLAGTPVVVELQRGRALAHSMCNDRRIGSTYRLHGTIPVVEGRGQFLLDSRTCPGGGWLELGELVAEDGTRIEPLRIETNQIGCVHG